MIGTAKDDPQACQVSNPTLLEHATGRLFYGDYADEYSFVMRASTGKYSRIRAQRICLTSIHQRALSSYLAQIQRLVFPHTGGQRGHGMLETGRPASRSAYTARCGGLSADGSLLAGEKDDTTMATDRTGQAWPMAKHSIRQAGGLQ